MCIYEFVCVHLIWHFMLPYILRKSINEAKRKIHTAHDTQYISARQTHFHLYVEHNIITIYMLMLYLYIIYMTTARSRYCIYCSIEYAEYIRSSYRRIPSAITLSSHVESYLWKDRAHATNFHNSHPFRLYVVEEPRPICE